MIWPSKEVKHGKKKAISFKSGLKLLMYRRKKIYFINIVLPTHWNSSPRIFGAHHCSLQTEYYID